MQTMVSFMWSKYSISAAAGLLNRQPMGMSQWFKFFYLRPLSTNCNKTVFNKFYIQTWNVWRLSCYWAKGNPKSRSVEIQYVLFLYSSLTLHIPKAFRQKYQKLFLITFYLYDKIMFACHISIQWFCLIVLIVNNKLYTEWSTKLNQKLLFTS